MGGWPGPRWGAGTQHSGVSSIFLPAAAQEHRAETRGSQGAAPSGPRLPGCFKLSLSGGTSLTAKELFLHSIMLTPDPVGTHGLSVLSLFPHTGCCPGCSPCFCTQGAMPSAEVSAIATSASSWLSCFPCPYTVSLKSLRPPGKSVSHDNQSHRSFCMMVSSPGGES